MSTLKLSILFIVITIICTFIILTVIHLNPIEAHVIEEVSATVVSLPASKLEKSDGTVSFRAYGIVSSKQQVAISGLISGQVMEVSPKSKKGYFLEQGEEVYRVDETEYASRLREYQASLKRINTQVHSAETQLHYLEEEKKISNQNLALSLKEFNRFKELTAKDVASNDLLDQAQSKLLSQQSMTLNLNKSYDAKKDEILILKAQLLEMQERIIQAEFQRNQSKIKMPFSGIIEKASIEKGMVAQAGVSYLSIYNPLVWEVELFLPVELQTYLHQDTTAKLSFANAQEIKQLAKFNRMNGAVNVKTRMVGSIFDFYVDKPIEHLMNNEFVVAEIHFSFDKDFIVIQKEMIRNNCIFYIEGDAVKQEILQDYIDFKHFVVCFDVSKFKKSVVQNPDKFIHEGMKAIALIRE